VIKVKNGTSDAPPRRHDPDVWMLGQIDALGAQVATLTARIDQLIAAMAAELFSATRRLRTDACAMNCVYTGVMDSPTARIRCATSSCKNTFKLRAS